MVVSAFRHRVQFHDSVPVTACSQRSAQRLLQRFSGELGIGSAVREMQIECGSAEVIPIAAVRVLSDDAVQSLGCILGWYREEKPCVHPRTIRFGFRSERIGVDDLAKLLVGSYQ